MNKNLQIAFIYKLYLKDNPNIAYIGQTTNINTRYNLHIKYAKSLPNLSTRLYFFMNFYGIDNFKIEIIQTLHDVSKNTLNQLENESIKTYGTLNSVNLNPDIVLNITPTLCLEYIDSLHKNNIQTQTIDQVSRILNHIINPPLNIKNNTTQTNTLHDTPETPQIPPPPSRKDNNEYMKWWRKYKQTEQQKQINKDNTNKINRDRYHNDPQYKEKKKQYIKKPTKPPITLQLEDGTYKCNACQTIVKDIKQHINSKKHSLLSQNY